MRGRAVATVQSVDPARARPALRPGWLSKPAMWVVSGALELSAALKDPTSRDDQCSTGGQLLRPPRLAAIAAPLADALPISFPSAHRNAGQSPASGNTSSPPLLTRKSLPSVPACVPAAHLRDRTDPIATCGAQVIGVRSGPEGRSSAPLLRGKRARPTAGWAPRSQPKASFAVIGTRKRKSYRRKGRDLPLAHTFRL